MSQQKPWWDEVTVEAGGDVIVGQVGVRAENVAVSCRLAVRSDTDC